MNETARFLECLVGNGCKLEEVVVVEAKEKSRPSPGNEDRRPRHLGKGKKCITEKNWMVEEIKEELPRLGYEDTSL